MERCAAVADRLDFSIESPLHCEPSSNRSSSRDDRTPSNRLKSLLKLTGHNRSLCLRRIDANADIGGAFSRRVKCERATASADRHPKLYLDAQQT